MICHQSKRFYWLWTLRHAWARMFSSQWRVLWLLFGWAVLYGLWVYPLFGQRDELQEQLSTHAASLASDRPKAPEKQEHLAAFYAHFPAEIQLVKILARLHDAAPRRNLSLPQGEYRLMAGQENTSTSVRKTHDSLMRYEIVLPVKGNYQDIRGYVSDVLTDQPCIALDALTFMRESSARVGVDAELHFTLYVRSGT